MHTPVLLKEVIDGLEIKKGDIVLDGTLGDGGHSVLICDAIGSEGRLIGIDQDEVAIARAKERLKDRACRFDFKKDNFKNLEKVLKEFDVESVDKVFLDLGLRSGHLEESGRGFSFKKDEPLLMTFNSSPDDNTLTAYEIINTWDEDSLLKIIKEYGEERFARNIAKNIVQSRKENLISTTYDLVKIIKESIPNKFQKGRLHFATKTFQALRIAVNDEIEVLKDGLESAVKVLNTGGVLAVITFHSLEDRVVKHFFREKGREEEFINITKKPIVPSDKEIKENPRSRSAKLRILKKI